MQHQHAAHGIAFGGNTMPLYQSLDWLLVRAPLLPIERYLALGRPAPDDLAMSNDGEPCEAAIDDRPAVLDPQVRLALAVGSLTFLNALDRPSPGVARVLRRERKLLRYLIRMSTRPTPYGLFAGVALAGWGARTDLMLAEVPSRALVRLDVGWLYRLVASLEVQPEIRQCLRISANPAAFVRVGRIFLVARTPDGDHAGQPRISIRATRAASQALAIAHRPVSYHELINRLLETLPGATQERVKALVARLLDQAFLLTDLRPPLTTDDPAKYVASRLADIPAAGHTLSQLQSLINAAAAWETPRAEEDVIAYERLTTRANSLMPTTRDTDLPLHVDMAVSLGGCHVAREIGTEAAYAAELLLRLTPFPHGLPYITAYREAFEARYGRVREVGLPDLDLLDPGFGLNPASGDGNRSGRNDDMVSSSPRRQQALLDLAYAASRERRLAIELDRDTLARLETWSPSHGEAPTSLDINVFVTAASKAAIDAGQFEVVVGPNLGARSAGRNLGRFVALLGEEAREALQRLDRTEEAFAPNHLRAELVYLTQRLHSANVAVRSAIRDYEITFAVGPGVVPSRVIPLEELVLGIRNDRFYLRWPAGDTDVIVCSGHMLNNMHAPAIYRFLADVSQDNRPYLHSFDWGIAANLPFLPRVQVGRIILSPAQWRISSQVRDGMLPINSPRSFREALGSWRAHWQVPRHVYLSMGDNRLLLDLENIQQIEELRDELGGRHIEPAVILQEALPGPEHTWVQGPGGRFVTEFSIPLILRGAPSPSASVADVPAPDARDDGGPTITTSAAVGRISPAHRLRPPGSDWLFLKLYSPHTIEDDLIVGPVRSIVTEALAQGWAKDWHFLRYTDPDPHLRLRFRGEPERLIGQLLPTLSSWGGKLLTEGLCLRLCYDTYEREIERYGGLRGLEVAETFFGVDSLVVAEFLCTIRAGASAHEPVLLAALSVDQLLAGLGLSENSRLHWYREQGPSRDEAGEEYRRYKSALRLLLSDPGGGAGEGIARIFAEERDALAPVTEQLARLIDRGELTCTPGSIYRSFVHLHLNRLLGADRGREWMILGLLRRTREGLRRAPITLDPEGRLA